MQRASHCEARVGHLLAPALGQAWSWCPWWLLGSIICEEHRLLANSLLLP